jgi:hypothetical protein
MNKLELKKQLQYLDIKVEGNYVRKSDIKKILSDAGNLSGQQSVMTNKQIEQEVLKAAKKAGYKVLKIGRVYSKTVHEDASGSAFEYLFKLVLQNEEEKEFAFRFFLNFNGVKYEIEEGSWS